MLELARSGRGLGERRSFADQGLEMRVRRQLVERGQLAELAHCSCLRLLVSDLLAAPEIKGGVGLECGHHQQDLAVEREGWRAPFQRLLHLRDGGVDALTDM